MKLTVNGDVRTFAGAEMTVRQLIEKLELTSGPVAVELNGQVVVRAEHTTSQLHDGDLLEIVHFVGGG